jgi:hypothetical protein
MINPLIDFDINQIQEKVNAEPLSSVFLYADNLTLGEVQSGVGFLPCSEAERHSLVKASKSPTAPQVLLDSAYAKQKFLFQQDFNLYNHSLKDHTLPIQAAQESELELPPQITPLNSTGCRAVFEFREWCDEWRIRSEVDGQNLQPPEQAGDRVSEMLTHRGATKLAESCAYMAACRGGYKTFVTGTFSADRREAIANGNTSIQKEVSRTMDAMSKMYSRGWTKDNGERVQGVEGSLSYCWVVEIPKNDEGEENPHVHMLLGWRVSYGDFKEWSARIEKQWGNGYFHLEKIKDSTCAGAYMAKAAGYMSKAEGNDTQGTVVGNRYGISACARAPAWETYAVKQLHCMSQLIVDVYDHLTVAHGEKYKERKRLNNSLAKLPKEKRALRNSIGKKLAEVRKKINEIPVRCNKYQMLLKSKGDFFRFMSWAVSDTDNGGDWLPAKEKGLAYESGRTPEAKDSLYHTKLRETIRARAVWRRLADVPSRLAWCDSEWSQIKESYQSLLDQFDSEPIFEPNFS